MPVLPEKFRENFEVKEFTKNGDRATVLKIYSKFFQHVDTEVTWPVRVGYMAVVVALCTIPFAVCSMPFIPVDQ